MTKDRHRRLAMRHALADLHSHEPPPVEASSDHAAALVRDHVVHPRLGQVLRASRLSQRIDAPEQSGDPRRQMRQAHVLGEEVVRT